MSYPLAFVALFGFQRAFGAKIMSHPLAFVALFGFQRAFGAKIMSHPLAFVALFGFQRAFGAKIISPPLILMVPRKTSEGNRKLFEVPLNPLQPRNLLQKVTDYQASPE